MTDHENKMLAQQALLALDTTPKPGERWVHYKGGEYEIVAVSLQEDTLEPLVTYRSTRYGTTWTRTLANFLEAVQADDQPDFSRPRFALITR